MTEQDVLAEVERLRLLVSQFTMPAQLTAEQRAGSACAWCGGKPGPATADLHAVGMTPRGCSDCYWARLNWITSWYDWQDHIAECEYCLGGSMCFVSHGRRTTHEQTITDAGQPELSCGSCTGPILRTEMAVPRRWDGDTAPYLGYIHLRCAARRRVR
ncbi:hypothetical protein ACH47Z_18210 [Streptomyces sp. NPDC020192]|uniref:hypothetical protein n=1 Tax=Streptomyces sp. NPDC020192 TaxID=3365066 RepID=UPI003793C4E6